MQTCLRYTVVLLCWTAFMVPPLLAQNENFVRFRAEVGVTGLESEYSYARSDFRRFEAVSPGPAVSLGIEKSYYVTGIDNFSINAALMVQYNTFSRSTEWVSIDANIIRLMERHRFENLFMMLPINGEIHYKKFSVAAGFVGILPLLSRVQERYEYRDQMMPENNRTSQRTYQTGDEKELDVGIVESVYFENWLDAQFTISLNYAASEKISFSALYRNWTHRNSIKIKEENVDFGGISVREMKHRSKTFSLAMTYRI